tara:strand:+ start:8321 stop:8920 length:600 start_codon:yes stop_codon:yes gene_type:complete
MATLNTTNLKHASSGSNNIVLAADGSTTISGNATCSGTATGFGGGKILQVKQTVQTSRVSETLTDNTYTDISGLSVDITPSATSSKILVTYHLSLCTNSGTYNVMTRIMRGSTAIGIGDQVGSYRQRATNIGWTINAYQSVNYDNMFLDSPDTTSSTTYKLQWTDSYGQTVYLNRIWQDADTKYYPTVMSHITVMEVAA